MIYATSGSLEDPTKLVLIKENGEKRTIIRDNFLGYPSFSPDSNLIAFLKRKNLGKNINWIDDWYLYLTDTEGSFQKELSDLSLYHHRPSWFPDGNRLVVTKKDLSIYIVDVTSNEEFKIIEYGSAPTVSNNGKYIAYLAKDLDATQLSSLKEYMQMTVAEYNDAINENGAKAKDIQKTESLLLRNAIYIYDVELKTSKKITEVLSVEAPGVWSPSDDFLLFNDERSLGHELSLLNINSGEIENLKGQNGKIMFWDE